MNRRFFPLPSPLEMAAADKQTIASGISSAELMERAGRGIAEQILQRYSGTCANFLFLVGPGNNGGDGLVIARILAEAGESVVVRRASASRYTDDHKRELERFEKVSREIEIITENSCEINGQLERDLLSATVVVDALLGTGTESAPRGVIAQMIKCLNRIQESRYNPVIVIAVDLPSGINSDSGAINDATVRADITYTIQAPKRGMLQSPAAEYCGSIIVLPIGITIDEGVEFRLLNSESVIKFPARSRSAHKGEFGHVLVIAGSTAMPGAARLASLAALRSGCGLVTKVSWGNDLEGESGADPEVMLLNLGQDSHLKPAHLKAMEPYINKADVIVVGPGLGTDAETVTTVLELLKICKAVSRSILLDADGLNAIALGRDQWQNTNLLSNAVLTPHPGEMGRLLGKSIPEIESDRYCAARQLAKESGAVVVLKGASSIVYSGTHGSVNSSGNPYMASAGSGDVLAGVTAAVLAQRALKSESMLDRVSLAVYLHGLAGDLVQENSPGPMIASDLISKLSQAVWNCTLANDIANYTSVQ